MNLTLPIPIFELSLGLALLGHDWRRKAAGVMVLAFCIIVFVSDQLSVWLPSSLDWFYTNPASTCLACAVAFGALAPLVCRGKRARILLLRPFGQAEMTSALKRVVRKHVGIVGSVFTLSDRHYKPSIAMDVMKFIGSFGGMAASLRHLAGPLLRPSVRIANVWNEGSFRNLARTLAHNFVLDFQSAYSGNQAFNIASSDNWWKYCIELLMHSTDFAVMDISRVSTGSAWEITQLDRRNVLDRCIFIVQEAYAGDALKEIGGLVPGVATPDLHVFGISGEFIEPARFEMALNRMVTAAQAATHSTA